MENQKYYVTIVTYVGPDQDSDRYIDADRIEIATRPVEYVINAAIYEKTLEAKRARKQGK
jgi:hypothetical protein